MITAPAELRTTPLQHGPNQKDRERALLLLADAGRTMQPEPQDILALIDFMREEGV